jgi:hypothetical protein
VPASKALSIQLLGLIANWSMSRERRKRFILEEAITVVFKHRSGYHIQDNLSLPLLRLVQKLQLFHG